jgi:alcohol dehydrogenase (cytochrome c)
MRKCAHPKPEDWLLYRGNYAGWGYSPLEQINKANAKTLQLVWSRIMEPGLNEITPIVRDGIMYLGNPGDVIQAIDATNGDLIWEYRHPLPPKEQFPGTHGQRKRSIRCTAISSSSRPGTITSSGSTPAPDNGCGRAIVAATSMCRIRAAHWSRTACYCGQHVSGRGSWLLRPPATTPQRRELWRNEMIPKPGEPGDETWGRRAV